MFSCPVLLFSLLAWALMLDGTQGLDIGIADEFPGYTRYFDYDTEGVTRDFARQYCEDEGLRLARIKDWTLLDALQEPSSWDQYWIDAIKSPGDIYFRDQFKRISTNALDYQSYGYPIIVHYGDTQSLGIQDLRIQIHELAAYVGGFLCEVPYVDDTPEKDVGYVTCEPYEEWEIVTSTIDLGFDEAVEFCKDQDGEMLSLYTKLDVDWAAATGLIGPYVYWQDFKNYAFDNTLRWANGYALLPSTDPQKPFFIDTDELLWDNYYHDFHHFPEFSALVYNHGTATAGFVDIRSYSARAVCKVHISVKDECEPDPCENGGTCLDQVGDYYCACTKDYTGKNCSIEVNDCAPNPCYNGGTCYTNDESEWECACPSGYEGDRCQDNIDECGTTNPCKNGGTCFDGDNEYTCSCPAKVQGPNCELDTRMCKLNTCKNSGTCVELPDLPQYHCVCEGDYYGDDCELLPRCLSSPCGPGTCVDIRDENDYQCSCPQGYKGDNCQERDCSYLDCYNKGISVINTRTQVCLCVCTAEYDGDNCQNKKVVPAPNPCLNLCPNQICDVINDRAVCRPQTADPPPPPPTRLAPPPPPPPPEPVLTSQETLIIGLSVTGGVVLIIIIIVVITRISRPAGLPRISPFSPHQSMAMHPAISPQQSMAMHPAQKTSLYGFGLYARQMRVPYGRPNYGFGYA